MKRRPVACLVALALGLAVDSTADDWFRAGPDAGTVTALATHSTDPETALAGTHFGGIFRTIDGGESWSPSGLRGLEILVVEYSTADPTVVFAGLSRWSRGGAAGGVYRSDDGGLSWVPARAGLEDGSYPPDSPHYHYYEVSGLALDPRDPSVAWAATEKGLFKTIDSGSSWSYEPQFGQRRPFSVAVTSTDPAEVFLSWVYGGVYTSKDGGVSWEDASAGLEYVYNGEVGVRNVYRMIETSWWPGALIAIGESNGVVFFDPETREWSGVRIYLGPRGAYNERWLTDIEAGSPGTQNVWLATGWDGIIHSGSGGESWAYTESVGIECLLAGQRESYLHIPALAVFAGEGDRLLASADNRGVMRSFDRGETWHPASSGLSNTFVSSFVVGPSQPPKLAVATVGHGLFYSEDGGEAWWEVLSGDVHPCSYLSPIAWANPPPDCWRWTEIRRTFDGELLVRGECGIYASSNQGATWRPVDEPVRWPLAELRDGLVRYAETSAEAFVSADSGVSWQQCGALPGPGWAGQGIKQLAVQRTNQLHVSVGRPEVVLNLVAQLIVDDGPLS